MAVYGKQADVDANQGKNIQLWTPDTKMTSADTFLGGEGTGVTNEMLNGAQRIYGNTTQDTAMAYDESMKFNAEREMIAMQQSAGGMRDASVQSSQAQLQANLNSQISQLSMAYDEAITDGKISIREAEEAFLKQKAEIEKQAYTDAERTSLYGQNMGIQNSQQMLGLQAGDNARTNSLHREGMSERDSKIANITDRLRSVKTQKDIKLAQANNEYNTGLIGAKANADSMYNQNMFGMQADALNANRTQAFAEKNMGIQQGYQKENMSIAQDYHKLNAIQQQEFVEKNMFTSHQYDKEKMSINFAQDLQKMATQHGYSSALQSQAGQQAMNQYIAKFQMEQQAEIDAYNLATEREYAKGVGGTKENVINERQKKEALQMKLGSNYAEALSEKTLSQIYGSSALDGLANEPKNYIKEGSKNDSAFFGGIMNAITGYDKKQASYENRQEAEAIIRAFEADPFNYK